MSIKNSEPIWFGEEEKAPETKDLKIMVATPCHSEMSIHYVQSILELQKFCFKNHIPIEFRMFKSSLVTQGRNLSVASFLSKNFSHMLFVDSDIAFQPESLLKLIKADKPVISIPYPLKDICWDKAFYMFEKDRIKSVEDLQYKSMYRYPMKVANNNDIKIKSGVIEVTHSPTGFMLIKKETINQMIEKYPNLKIEQDTLMNGKHKKIEHMWNFFDTIHDPETKTYLGEDFAFCKLWRDIGGK